MLKDRSPDVNTLFELCGAFASPRISSTIYSAIADCLQLHLAGLLVLSDISLVSWPEGKDYFVLHSLIHEYATERLRAAPRSLEILNCFSAHYAERANGWQHSTDWLELNTELENVLRAADYAYQLQDWDCFRHYWSPVTHQLRLNGDRQRYVAYNIKFLEAARLQGDQGNASQILSELGWVQMESGELDTADQTLRDSLALCDVLPDTDYQRARVLRYQAKIFVKRDQPERALVLLQEAEDILYQLGPVADRVALALSLLYINRAQIAYRAQQHEQAQKAA